MRQQIRLEARLWYDVLVLGLFLLLSSCDQPQMATPPPPEVFVAAPLIKPIREWDEYTGRFEAVDKVEVRARVGGFLQSVNFRDGSIVHEGDLLFVIDSRPFRAVVDRAKADVLRAEARVAVTMRELNRASELRKSSFGSQQNYEAKLSEKREADGGLLSAQANLRLAELDLEFCNVRAPISGRISKAEVTAGNLVSGGTAGSTLLTNIVSLAPIRFEFDISESAALKYLRLGYSGRRPTSRNSPNRVQVRLFDEREWTREGRMEYVDNRFDENTGTLRERAIFENRDGFLIPGSFGRLRVVASDLYDAMLLPDSAIGTDQSRKVVAVVGSENKVEMKVVTLGPLYEGLRIVQEGLEPTDQVIINGLMRVRPGAVVAPTPAKIEETQSMGTP